jgi:hypothetical protein
VTDDPLPLATTIKAASEIVAAKLADPIGVSERPEVLAAIHGLESATGPVREHLEECLGLIDGVGRCRECGRLVAWGMWRAQTHKDGGCLMAVPFVGTVLWAKHNPEGIPLFGQWLYRRRRKALMGDPTSNGHRPG